MTTILDLPTPPADARIAYGLGPFHFGDLRLPPGAGPHPVVINIHGGFWRAAYDLEHAGHLCAALTARGVATWNIEYRRLGHVGGGWPGTFQDVAAAVAFLPTLADQYPLDLTRIVVMGHSAGGHLALWVAGEVQRTVEGERGSGREREQERTENGQWLTDGPHEAQGVRTAGKSKIENPKSQISVVSLAGVVDLERAWTLGLSGGVVGELLGGAPVEVPERYAAASPIQRLPLGVPAVLLHGAADEIVPLEISERYAAAARTVGDEVKLVPLPGAGHFEMIDPRTREWGIVARAVLALL